MKITSWIEINYLFACSTHKTISWLWWSNLQFNGERMKWTVISFIAFATIVMLTTLGNLNLTFAILTSHYPSKSQSKINFKQFCQIPFHWKRRHKFFLLYIKAYRLCIFRYITKGKNILYDYVWDLYPQCQWWYHHRNH